MDADAAVVDEAFGVWSLDVVCCMLVLDKRLDKRLDVVG